MGNTRKVDPVQLQKLLEQGWTSKQCSEYFSCDVSTINKQRKKSSLEAIRYINQKAAHRIFNHSSKQAARLNNMINSLENLRAHIEKVVSGDEKSIRLWEKSKIKRVVAMDPGMLLVKINQELRCLMELQVKIYKTFFDTEETALFQEITLEVIESVDPEIRREIVRRLERRKALSRSLTKL